MDGLSTGIRDKVPLCLAQNNPCRLPVKRKPDDDGKLFIIVEVQEKGNERLIARDREENEGGRDQTENVVIERQSSRTALDTSVYICG